MAGIYIYSNKRVVVAELTGFARGTGKEVNVIVFQLEEAEAIKNCGADHIYILNGASSLAENYGKAVAQFLKQEAAELFLVGASPSGRDIAARVAGYLNCGMVSDVSALSYDNGKLTTERMIYGGAIMQKEAWSGLTVATIPAGLFEPIEGVAEISSIAVETDNRVSLLETTSIVKEGADLSLADKVVCIGLGMEKEEDMQMARDLSGALGAELGCSRGIAEERHWLPVERYIGISGAIIKPQLYLAMGISGQVQHTIGIRDAKIVVAVNDNNKAPIFKVCDYGIVGDMYEIIPLLTEALN